MPQPTNAQIHTNRPLTGMSVAYQQANRVRFVADRAFAQIPVKHQGNLYYKYSRADWYRIQAELRGPASESAGSGWNLSTDSYFCNKFAIHKDVDDDSRANEDTALDGDMDAMNFVTEQLMLKREAEWVSQFFDTSVWTGGVTNDPTTTLEWNDDGDPIAQIRIQATAVQGKTGYRPNIAIMDAAVWDACADNSLVLDRIKHTQTGITTQELVARAAGLDEIMVLQAVRNTAKEGLTETVSFFGGGDEACLLLYRNPNPGLRAPSAGYNFVWSGLLGQQALSGRIKKFRMEELEADRIEGEIAYDPKLVAAELGVYMNSLLT